MTRSERSALRVWLRAGWAALVVAAMLALALPTSADRGVARGPQPPAPAADAASAPGAASHHRHGDAPRPVEVAAPSGAGDAAAIRRPD